MQFIGFSIFQTNRVEFRVSCPVTIPVTRCHEVMTEECWPRLFSWQCPVCPVPGSGHEVSVCNFSRHPMSCSGLQSPRWSLTSVSANQRPVSAVLTNERPRLGVELTWHLAHFCANYRLLLSADAWEPWTDPLDPGSRGWRNSSFWKKWSVTDLRWSLMTWSARLVSPRSSHPPSECRHHIWPIISQHSSHEVTDSDSWPY